MKQRKYLFEKLDLLSLFVATQIARAQPIDRAQETAISIGGPCFHKNVSLSFKINTLSSFMRRILIFLFEYGFYYTEKMETFFNNSLYYEQNNFLVTE